MKIMKYRAMARHATDPATTERMGTLVAELEQKLLQYPRGTAFIVQRSGNESADATAAISDLMAFAASRGLSIKDR